MPLTATVNDETIFAEDLSYPDRAPDHYFCRHCGGEMRLVLPTKDIVKHFRHVGENNCQPESMAHLRAKKFFYDLYRHNRHYRRVELEYRCEEEEIDGYVFDVGDRIGDIVLFPNVDDQNPTVIEVQNSQITKEEISWRFSDWNMWDDNCGYHYNMLWVLTKFYQSVPAWVRFLQSIYFGRVYTFSDDGIYATRYTNRDASGNPITSRIKNFSILQTESERKRKKITHLVQHFMGRMHTEYEYECIIDTEAEKEFEDFFREDPSYHISRFYDKKFW